MRAEDPTYDADPQVPVPKFPQQFPQQRPTRALRDPPWRQRSKMSRERG